MIGRAAFLAAVLVATPAQACVWQAACDVLWPRAPLPPVTSTGQFQPPLPVPAAEPEKPVPTLRPAQPAPRIKTKPAIAKQHKQAKVSARKIAEWCARVPSFATLDMIKAAAKQRGVTMTPAQIEQAKACLASKR